MFAIYVSYYIKVKLALSGMGGEVTLKLPFILGHIDDSLEADPEQDDYDATVEKKLEFEKNVNDDDAGAPTINVESPTIIADDGSSKKKSCRSDGETVTNGRKTIETCRNGNGLSIDVIVEDLSDKVADAVEVGARTAGNETERNINVVTAQIHSSAI